MKRYWFLAAFGFVVLAFAAVWLGALNQDEGWYLYAARLVSEGKTPYRDFFYTQAPVMPVVYAAFTFVWNSFGLLGARILTIVFGALGLAFFCALAARLVAPGRRALAALAVFLLLGSNLYHLYYIAIPKTYALASLFVAIGFFLLTFARPPTIRGGVFAFASGLSLAFACGTRISLGVILAVVGLGLLLSIRSWAKTFLWFGLGGAFGLAVVYGFFLCDPSSREGLFFAQAYHAARGGFDPVFTIGSVSRLVRWYLPVFILLGLGFAHRREAGGETDALLVARLAFASFVAVFLVQMLAPFPYEDYQVPVMGLLAVFAAVLFFGRPASVPSRGLLLTLGLAWAASFGSPLLEKWTTNGQDRFWTLKKEQCELAQLRDVANRIEAMDPGGRELLTQDLYLAIETGRRVPEGLEMGPFSMLDDDGWRRLLESAPCRIAALSGYSFAIEPPACNERPVGQQMEYWSILKRRYGLAWKEDDFGQNSTTLVVLERNDGK